MTLSLRAMRYNRMIHLGVDAIVSDYPGRVQRHLSDAGIGWRSESSEGNGASVVESTSIV